ncbi:MAG: ABC transporter permease [Sedimentisphaerales bacterium]|nr:ABC transporter permease [Sedimentisphaerales bacterium]
MNVLRIALNDVRVVLKDRMVLVWWLAMPLAFVFMFSFMAGDRTQDGTWLPVVKLDDHELADIFIDQLRAEKYWIEVKTAADEPAVRDWVRAAVIPATFSSDILAGERVDLTLTKGQGSPEKLLAAQTLLVRALIRFNGAVAAVDLIERGWSEEAKQDLLAELAKPSQLTVVNEQHFSLRPPPSGFAFTLPAYLVMFVMMMTVMYGGITLVYERSQKRIQRLVAAPVSVPEIFAGKMLGRMLQPVLQGGLLILAGVTIFRVNLGDHPSALIPVILCFAFFCGALGLLFGVLFRTEQQVNGFGVLATMVLAALGGCWWPLDVVPQTFKTIALFTPSYWAIQGLHDVMSFGKSWPDVLPECAILAAFGAVLTAIAIPLFHWE